MADITLTVSVETGIADIDQAHADLHDVIAQWCGARGFSVVISDESNWLEHRLAGALRMMIAQAEAADCVIEDTHDLARVALAQYDAIYSDSDDA